MKSFKDLMKECANKEGMEEDFSMPWVDLIYFLEKEYWA